MHRTTFIALALAAACGVLALRPSLAADEQPGAWLIDPVHSAIVWTIGHNNGVGTVYGRFDSFAGTIIADPAHPERSSVEVTVDASSLDTAVAARDEHLRTPDFFNVAAFPSLSFKSSGVTPVAGESGLFDVAGDLTILGVSRPLTVRAKFHGAGKDMKGVPVAGFSAGFSIKRSDFGMAFGIPGIGDEVNVQLAFECSQPQPTAPAER
jgi:polyisoprenoid-binding protein YceI